MCSSTPRRCAFNTIIAFYVRLGDSGRSHAAILLGRRIEAMSPVTANGFSPDAYRGRDNTAERRADVSPMRVRAGLATTAAASVRPKICEPEVPLPIR